MVGPPADQRMFVFPSPEGTLRLAHFPHGGDISPAGFCPDLIRLLTYSIYLFSQKLCYLGKIKRPCVHN